MQMPVATLVRTAVAEWVKARSDAGQLLSAGAVPSGAQNAITKVTLRMAARHAAGLACAAREAGLSQGFYVARLMDGQPPVPVPPDQRENWAALVRSNAVLAAMANDLDELMRVMRQASSPGQAACSDAVAELSDVVKRHLVATAPLIAALRPSRCLGAGDLV